MKYDLVVIGGGPGGYTAAARAAELGMMTAIVEMDALGGTCLNRGCIPTACMLHAGVLCRRTRESGRFGIMTQDVTLDYGRLLAYRSETVRTMVQGVEQILERNRIVRFSGRGTLLPGLRVRVTADCVQTELAAGAVLLATGSAARVPDIPGIDLPGVTDSEGALTWDSLPESVTVIGGGVIGVEYAQIFADLGSRVTLLGTRDRLLPSMDREISQNLKMILKKRGVDIHTGVTVRQIGREGESLCCIYAERDAEKQVLSQRVLYAVGRVPKTEGLFEGVTVNMDNGRILVDSHFMTDLEGVYAVGDAVGGSTAHLAAAQGTAAAERIAGKASSIDVDTVPDCIYTNPEIASVGLTERQAREAGYSVKVGRGLTGRNGRSAASGEERGFVKLVASVDDGTILGAQLMCACAGDMLGELVSAVSNHFTAGQLLRAIRPHPTYNEILRDAIQDLNEND